MRKSNPLLRFGGPRHTQYTNDALLGLYQLGSAIELYPLKLVVLHGVRRFDMWNAFVLWPALNQSPATTIAQSHIVVGAGMVLVAPRALGMTHSRQRLNTNPEVRISVLQAYVDESQIHSDIISHIVQAADAVQFPGAQVRLHFKFTHS